MEFAAFFEAWAPAMMFIALALLIFTGYPVAFVLGGIGLLFAIIGDMTGVMNFQRMATLSGRIFGGTYESPVLVAIPMFIYMGTMLEKSGVAADLLHCLQVLLRKVPGGLAMSVTLMGTIMAATTGIIGASVVMMTLLALPVMLERGYNVPLATGTIASSGTLGILIPPSIMLVIMADLMQLSVGDVFVAAMIPGLILSGLYAVYIGILCFFKPDLAPPLPDDIGPDTTGEFVSMIAWSFLPPIFLIVVVLGSIFGGLATPTEAAGVGALGATVLAALKSRLTGANLNEVCYRSALTTAMLFGIFLGATCFSLVFRSLGGDEFIRHLIDGFESPWAIIFLLMGMVFFLGFFFDWIEITLIVLPVFGPIVADPAIVDIGYHIAPAFDAAIRAGELSGAELRTATDYISEQTLLWFTVLVAVNLQTSFLTPPFGFALFYMKGVAPPEVKMEQIYKGIVPFVLLQLFGLAMVIWFPQIALYLPEYLLD